MTEKPKMNSYKLKGDKWQ